MKERPILFSAPMVRAILDGRKRQTRRVVKLLGADCIEDRGKGPREVPWPWSPQADEWLACPYGQPGDCLWVRETWAPCEAEVRKKHVQYAADGAVGHHVTTNGGERWWERSGHTMGVADAGLQGVWVSKPARWRPSIHMPRWASRITLEVTGVRVERLQDITEEDARAEGCVAIERSEEWMATRVKADGRREGFFHDREPSASLVSELRLERVQRVPAKVDLSARQGFERLWESINGSGSWSANPWVWVVEFRGLP